MVNYEIEYLKLHSCHELLLLVQPAVMIHHELLFAGRNLTCILPEQRLSIYGGGGTESRLKVYVFAVLWKMVISFHYALSGFLFGIQYVAPKIIAFVQWSRFMTQYIIIERCIKKSKFVEKCQLLYPYTDAYFQRKMQRAMSQIKDTH